MDVSCFISNFSSTELAAWVQAIGSVVAIAVATWIAIHQAKLQHQYSLDLHRTEKRVERVDIARTLSVLAENAAKAIRHIKKQLKDRESIHLAADGVFHCDVEELRRIDNYLSSIPLHTVPFTLVTATMILESIVRQFLEKTEMALRLSRQMDANMFDDFFLTTSELNSSIDATCRDIEKEIIKLQMN